MKTKHAISLLIIGYCFDFIGALNKILHTPIADNLLIAAMVLKVTGGILFLYKLLTNPKAKEFLDW
jgi:hypothetical protein